MEMTWYDKKVDILNVELKKGKYWESIELSEGIIMDIAEDGSLLAIEIHHASKVFSGDVKKVIEKAKLVTA